jgi:hypothetical protein
MFHIPKEARRGYLNIRVPPSYMDILNQNKEKTIDELENSGHIVKQRIAQIIRAGLDMFDIPEEYDPNLFVFRRLVD